MDSAADRSNVRSLSNLMPLRGAVGPGCGGNRGARAPPMRLLSQPQSSLRLAGHPIRIMGRPRGARATADAPDAPGLGKTRSDTYRRRFIGTLAGRVQVCAYRHAQVW